MSISKSWPEIKKDAQDAYNKAKYGYKAEPSSRVWGPTYTPNNPQPSQPQAPSSDQSSVTQESRLRQLRQLYESGNIDREDYERQKDRILSEI
jgi:hypothetical protein